MGAFCDLVAEGVLKGEGRQGWRGNVRGSVPRSVYSCRGYKGCLSDQLPGREVETGRQVAVKKIKVGQLKDGLDMSAIREVKFLRELKHQNIIEVRLLCLHYVLDFNEQLVTGCLLFKNESQSRP